MVYLVCLLSGDGAREVPGRRSAQRQGIEAARIHQFQRLATTPGNAGQRIVSHDHRQAGLFTQQTVDIAQQRAPPL